MYLLGPLYTVAVIFSTFSKRVYKVREQVKDIYLNAKTDSNMEIFEHLPSTRSVGSIT